MRVGRPVVFEFTGLAFLRLRRSFSEGALLLFWGNAKKVRGQEESSFGQKKTFFQKFGMTHIVGLARKFRVI